VKDGIKGKEGKVNTGSAGKDGSMLLMLVTRSQGSMVLTGTTGSAYEKLLCAQNSLYNELLMKIEKKMNARSAGEDGRCC
jgi:hypothetical protein